MTAPFPDPSELLGPLPARRGVRKAVILAAGRGRRMGKLTKDRPKAALEVAGHALLDWQIAALRRAGVEKIAVVTGHGADALAGRDVDYIHNPDWAKGTQVDTLLCATHWIGDEPVIVSYSDILYHPSAALALLERPGDIIIAYDADHRWLWKRRFGNWLKDSETFRLGPGQVLAEIGGKPHDIEEVEGQFMGLMLFTPVGLCQLADHYRGLPDEERERVDFTGLLARLIRTETRIDTAANLLPWMEIDSSKDLAIAQKMATADEDDGRLPGLAFTNGIAASASDVTSMPLGHRRPGGAESADPAAHSGRLPQCSAEYDAIRRFKVDGAFAIQNWGRSGSTFLQSLLDNHPQVLSTPNFYSRRFYGAWARHICLVPDAQKIDAFLAEFRQWWDTGLVDATAGLHRLGPSRDQIAGVDRTVLEGFIRAAFAGGAPITRRSMFASAHLAYALARGQTLQVHGLQVQFPIHDRPRGVACALIEDFPEARFIHTVREPVSNVASELQHVARNRLDWRRSAWEVVLSPLFLRRVAGEVTFTSFGDRPYLSQLATHDRARFLRLEDLHSDGPGVLDTTRAWLGLAEHDVLLESTWDGKTWWNRPETGSVSSLGSTDLSRNVETRLTPDDRRWVMSAVASSPSISALYPGSSWSRPLWFGAALAILRNWHQGKGDNISVVRRAIALRGISTVMPQPVAAKISRTVAKEIVRARALAMSAGTVTVRQRLTPSQRSRPVDAILLLRDVGGEWRTRVLVRRHVAHGENDMDSLQVGFLQDAILTPSTSAHLRWFLALAIGGVLASANTFIRERVIALRLLRPALNATGRQPILALLNGAHSPRHNS